MWERIWVKCSKEWNKHRHLIAFMIRWTAWSCGGQSMIWYTALWISRNRVLPAFYLFQSTSVLSYYSQWKDLCMSCGPSSITGINSAGFLDVSWSLHQSFYSSYGVISSDYLLVSASETRIVLFGLMECMASIQEMFDDRYPGLFGDSSPWESRYARPFEIRLWFQYGQMYTWYAGDS